MSKLPIVSVDSIALKFVDEIENYVEAGYDPFYDEEGFPGLDSEAAIDLALEVVRSKKKVLAKAAAGLISSNDTFKERLENIESSIVWELVHEESSLVEEVFASETFQRAFKEALARRLDGLSAEISGAGTSVSKLTD